MITVMTALKAGCEQKPKGGSLLGLDGTLFATTGINITAPPSNQTLTDSDDNSGTMTQGTIVGIAVGAALLLLGGIGLFWVYHRKQKRLYGEPVHSEYDGRSGGSKSITPPLVGGFTSSGGTAADQQKLAAMMQVSEYELRSQQRPASRFYGGGGGNAEYYDALEKEMYSFQPPNGATVTTTITSNNNNNNYHPNVNHHNYAFNSNIPGSGPHPTLPTHPAYDPRATHSRQGSNHSQAPTPEPPRPARTNTKPDSYALQAYLSAAEDATSLHLPGPPPGPPPPAAVAVSHTHNRSTSSSSLSHNNAMATTTTTFVTTQQPQPQPQQYQYQQPPQQQPTQQKHVRAAPPPPPPPPPRAKVPALQLPSIPRIRIPKKYTPPQISVEVPTPVDRHQKQSSSSPGSAVERRRPWAATAGDEGELKTGESSMYG